MEKRRLELTPLETFRAEVEYVAEDTWPVYVNGCHGLSETHGVLMVSFYSEHIQPTPALVIEGATSPGRTPDERKVDLPAPDPYQLASGKVRIVRRVEANLVMTLPTVKSMVDWLQKKIKEMEEQ